MTGINQYGNISSPDYTPHDEGENESSIGSRIGHYSMPYRRAPLPTGTPVNDDPLTVDYRAIAEEAAHPYNPPEQYNPALYQNTFSGSYTGGSEDWTPHHFHEPSWLSSSQAMFEDMWKPHHHKRYNKRASQAFVYALASPFYRLSEGKWYSHPNRARSFREPRRLANVPEKQIHNYFLNHGTTKRRKKKKFRPSRPKPRYTETPVSWTPF